MRIAAQQLTRVPDEFLVKIDKLEKDRRGEVVAIDPLTREYFVGSNVMEAYAQARAGFPDKRPFVFHRIGYPYVYRHVGGLKLVSK